MSGVLGIDPGVNGGLALLNGDRVMVDPMPVKAGEVDLSYLREWLLIRREDFDHAFLELAGTRPRQRMQDCAKQWRLFGELRGLLVGLRIPYTVVPSRNWSKEFPHGVTEQDKNKRYTAIKVARRKIATDLFPWVDFRGTENCTTEHEGMVDAALIAEFGRRHLIEEEN